MLARNVVEEIRRLLEEGKLSQRKISRQLGVSRGTVGAIASGTRPDYDAIRARDDEFLEPSGPPERCPTCGGTVYMPCQLCRVRDLAASRPRPLARVQDDDSLTLQLKDEHRRRYEEVRARRLSEPMCR